MKLSARNSLSGKIVAITRGPTSAKVKVDIGNGIIVTSSITTEAATREDALLGPKPGPIFCN